MALTFKTDITKYARGRRVNMEEWNSITRTAEAAIAFGVPVMPGSGANGVVTLTNDADKNILGISEASQVLPHTGDAYAQYDNVAICESGVIAVLLSKAVTKGAAARFKPSTGGWTDAAQGSDSVTVPGAQFEEDGASGAIGVVRYRRPVPSLSANS